MIASLGFLTIAVFLGLILFARASVTMTLVLLPIAAAVASGFAERLPQMALQGLETVAPVCALLMFAVLYFGLMIDTGLFRPLERSLLRAIRGDPVRLCVVTALLTTLVALDGDEAVTFVIAVNALLPLHRRMQLNPLVLPTIVGLAAGAQHMLPWRGPHAPAVAALQGGVSDLFVPLVPAMLAGIAWVLIVACLIGRSERRRIASLGGVPGDAGDLPCERLSSPVPPAISMFNAGLTCVVIILLFSGLVPAPLLFMAAFVVALPVNCRTREAQQRQLGSHAASVVLGTSMIFAAGIFTGVLNGTGMTRAMAEVIANAIPHAMASHLGALVAITSMPSSLVFPPDAYYYGVLPIFAETARRIGLDPFSIGRAALLGQTTTGFPVSPFAASTFILVGLAGVSLRDHQRFMFKWAFGTTVVMTVIAGLTRAI